MTVRTLPIWKRNAPAHERLYELAEMAREQPHLFDKWVIVYCVDDGKQFKVRSISGQFTSTSDTLGVLTAGIQHVWAET